MNDFALLYHLLDDTTKTNIKIELMREYFAKCSAADGAWAVHFLSGRRLTRLITVGNLWTWCAEKAGLPDWMFEECYGAVGDLAETMALVLPEHHAQSKGSLAEWVEQRIQPLTTLDEPRRKAALLTAWDDLSGDDRFVFNKLVTGGFRVGVSQRLVIRALAEASGLDTSVIAHRLMGNWKPTPQFFEQLLSPDTGETDLSHPYPFALAHPLQAEPETLGAPNEWLAEWKWDGIRGQVIRRGGASFLWSRGEELILDRFPELHESIGSLPDGTVLDGEVLAWKDGHVLPFAELQRRIGRKTIGKKLLADVPVRFMGFDVLELAGQDLRNEPFSLRREKLECVLDQRSLHSFIMPSPVVSADHWEGFAQLRETSRAEHVEGLMLKRKSSTYPVGRVTGTWWKWKVNPYSCDAVLIYAQRGHGRRASLYTDYTFGAWDQGVLVPFAKAYSGLTDAEIREVDRFVRLNTLEKFGPVRSVKPELVFELAFENIQISKRHKSGIAVRFPRIVRWRFDKKTADADTLESIKSLVPGVGS